MSGCAARVAAALAAVAGLLAFAWTARIGAAQAPAPGTLRVTVSLVTSDGATVPISRHALLVSDNPATTAPRRVVTGTDGVAVLRLPPGNYTVESDAPVAFQGREYLWVQTLDVPAGAEAALTFTAANAQAGAVTAASATPGARPVDNADVRTLWQQSVVSLWLPTAQASGFLVDPRGLVATSQQAVGTQTTVEVQLTPALKFAGRVLLADAANDVAVLRVDAAAVATIRPVPLGCGASLPALKNGQEIVSLDAATVGRVRETDGTVSRVNARAMIADLPLPRGAMGGPVFTATGTAIGLASLIGEKEGDARDESRVVRVDAVCDVVAKAIAALEKSPAATATPLPVEPSTAIPEGALEAMTRGRAGSLGAYRAASTGFDVSLLTPLQIYAGRESMDFANWALYMAEPPAALFVRVTPKLEEGLWATVARGLAMTQGIALPPIRRFLPGFGRMRALCGTTEVVPIHPFLLERRIRETDAIHEGLYVFPANALGPHCGTVTLQLYSDRADAKVDPVTIDPKVLQDLWNDLAPARAAR